MKARAAGLAIALAPIRAAVFCTALFWMAAPVACTDWSAEPTVDMSLALGWGLAVSTLVTLFLVPALYVTANDWGRWLERRRRSRGESQPLDQAA